MTTSKARELETIYARRFESNQAYRRQVWRVLVKEIFQRYVPQDGAVLDLGCGYGEFINTVRARVRYGMDLNPGSAARLDREVKFLEQDCSIEWQVPQNSIDTVFTSNFFEHLPNKDTLGRTFDQANRALKDGGRLVAMGPNIKYLPDRYWDFWDHQLPLSETSLCEGLATRGFQIEVCHPRFLPYTMVNSRQVPEIVLSCYLKFPPAWRFFGKQFLVVARKPIGGRLH